MQKDACEVDVRSGLAVGLRVAALALLLLSAGPASAQSLFDRVNSAAGELRRSLEKLAPPAGPASAPASDPTAGNESASDGAGQAVDPAPAAPRSGTPSAATTPIAPRSRNCGALGAGCADGTRDLASCVAQGEGYQHELIAAYLQPKLQAGNLSDAKRTMLEEDLRAVTAATVPPFRFVPPDPKNRNRHWQWMSSAEQHDVNMKTRDVTERLREECHARFSGFGRR